MESEKEFERIFQETSRMIYALGFRLFRNEHDAQDFLQDVYLEAYRKRDRYQGRSRYSTYLYSLALHFGLNRLRKKKLDFQPLDEAHTAAEVEAPEDAAPEMVRRELNSLPDVYRIPIVLHYYEKMSVARIAESLGQNENTVKSYLHRGRKILRQKIEERNDERT